MRNHYLVQDAQRKTYAYVNRANVEHLLYVPCPNIRPAMRIVIDRNPRPKAGTRVVDACSFPAS